MSLFDSASLVVTPNGYKAGKLYSIKPTSGAGDLDVVRATSATRVNEQGLIEIPRTNLLLRSEEFDNASWSKTAGVVVTSNSEISPNGTLTADTINFGASNRIVSQPTTLATGVIATGSVYIKGISGQTIQLAVGGVDVLFTLNGNWQKLEATRTSITSVFNLNTFGGATARIISVWGAQLEVGNVATEYIPTTSVIRTRFAGITQDGGSANNIPRLDYTNASCPSILVEPQRTNLFLRSEEFDNAYWSKLNLTITANAIQSPDGFVNADAFVESTDVAITNHQVSGGIFSVTSGVSYTFSLFVKPNSSRSLRVSFISSLFGTNAAFFDLQNKSILSQTGGIGTIVEYSNGFLRISYTATASSSGTGTFFFNSSSGTTRDYIGNGTTCFYLYGAQLEAGANATSYIPTVASTVTRNADVISKTGVSSLINSEEGCFFVDFLDMNISDNQLKEFSLSDGTVNNIIRLGYVANAGANFTISCNVILSNVTQFTFSQSFIKGVRNKILLRYKQGEFSLFRNGVLLTQQNSGNIFGSNILSQFHYSRNNAAAFFVGNVNSNLLLPYLTNQQCIELTTL